MKILAIHSGELEDNKVSAVDIWRVWRPMRELAKNTDWQIDHDTTFIRDFDKYKDKTEFTAEELEKAAEKLGQYDIVFTSYFSNPSSYTLMKVVEARYGTQLVIDLDDDMFSINPDNPFWLKMTDENVYHMQCMVRDNAWITTTTNILAERFRIRRPHAKDTVEVIPNFISKDYKPKKKTDKDHIMIGYFGGASHYTDLNETGCLEGIAKLMHENKNIRFTCVGMVNDKYTPRGRTDFIDGQRGHAWYKKLWPSLDFDIAIAPIEDNIFNWGKSDIKWQESTRMGAAVVASKIGPYKPHESGEEILLVQNDMDSWYRAVKHLVDHPEERDRLVSTATKRLSYIEDEWKRYKTFFERVKEAKDAHRNPTNNRKTNTTSKS